MDYKSIIWKAIRLKYKKPDSKPCGRESHFGKVC